MVQSYESVQQVDVPTSRVVKKTTVVGGQHPAQEYHTKKTIFRTYQIIWYILGFIEAFLALRVLLQVTGANPTAGFASFVYTISDFFAGPFINLFGVSASRGSVIEWSTFVAMLVYYLIAFAIVKLLVMAKPVDPVEVDQKIDENV